MGGFQTSHTMVIRLFGGMEVQADGASLPRLRSRRELWLLALLTLQQGRPAPRAWLAQTLWPFPDHSVDQAAYNLRRSLTNLRRALGEQAARIQSPASSTLVFDIAGVQSDVFAFDAAIARGDLASLEAAVGLHRGPMLHECAETWALEERARRQQQYIQALKTLSAHALAGGDYETAVSLLRQAAAVDAYWEPAQRALMEALAQSGDVHAALQTYQEFSLRLHRERGAYPGEETTALYHALRAGARQAAFPVAEPTEEPAHAAPQPILPAMRRLPVSLTPLIGRAQELREIEARLRLSRLLTLTGAGGIGKTRLAIQLAENICSEVRDGVCFVDMAALTDASQTVQMTASALEVQEEPGRPLLQTLVSFLHAKQLLLILDNCEHLVESCAHLSETLLRGSRALRILATSRQPLAVMGEAVWRVTSLSLPELRELPAGSDALMDASDNSPAVQLFVARAQAAAPDWRLTPQNAPAVVQVCRQLDGIPLALELAAARVRALPVERIAERLKDRFTLLNPASAADFPAPPAALSRQQTLEATILWSMDLLSEKDRAMLCALSVFIGGWALEAAEWMGGYQNISADDTLDMLTRLVDRSLVIYENEGGQARYRMLETVRQYSHEKLLTPDEKRMASERHQGFFLRLAEEAQPHLSGKDSARWLNQLEKEHDNLRTALESGEGVRLEEAIMGQATPLRIAAALWRFWHRRGYLSLGRRYLANVLEPAPNRSAARWRAEACIGAGMLAFAQGDNQAARPPLEESLAIGENLKEEAICGAALHSLGQVAWKRREWTEARALFMRALAIQRALENRTQVAVTLNYLGVVATDEGDFDGARLFFEESLAIARALEDRALVANSLHSLAHMAFYQDDYPAARHFYSEELKLARSIGDRDLTAIALHRLGCVCGAQEDYASARAFFEESLDIAKELARWDLLSAILLNLGGTVCAQEDYPAARAYFEQRLALNEELGDRPGISYALDAFAALLTAQHQERRAVLLFAAAQSLRETLGNPSAAINQAEMPRLLAARNVLGEDTFTQTWEEGRGQTLAQAIACARQNS